MKLSHNGDRIDPTLGELIASVSDVTFEYSDGTEKAYHLARLVLVETLKGASLRGKIVDRHFEC